MVNQLAVETFTRRRNSFREQMAPASVALVFSGRAPVRSNDVHYRFRQNSDFYYLTGFQEENCVLVVTPEGSTLFLPEADPEHAVWHGHQLGVSAAAEALGVEMAKDVAGFAEELPAILKNRQTLYYQYGRNPENDVLVMSKTDVALRRARRGDTAPLQILHPAVLLHEMRLIKSPEEVTAMEKCARVTREAHIDAMERTRPGMFEYELEAVFQYHFRRAGGFEGYPAIVASGPNACVLHHIENGRQMQADDLVLIDAGVELDLLNADVTRTFPVSGRFVGAARDVYELVLEVQKRAVDAAVVGNSMEELHSSVVRQLTEGLVGLGVLSGSVDGLIASEAYKPFFMHGTGHWLGTDVHDVGSYYHGGKARPFADGMIITVEPGLYFSPEHPQTPDRFRGIGVRIEDDILIRHTGPLNLTREIPKEIDQLEQLVGSRAGAALI